MIRHAEASRAGAPRGALLARATGGGARERRRGGRRRGNAVCFVVDPARGTLAPTPFAICRRCPAGDLVVVNDAATLPGAFTGGPATATPSRCARGRARGRAWTAVLFGAGDWRRDRGPCRPAAARAPARRSRSGRRPSAARVRRVSRRSRRAWSTLRFERAGDELWAALYRAGRPVQYAVPARAAAVCGRSRPLRQRGLGPSEMPSAGGPLLGILLELRRRGAEIAALTHAAGLSSTGDPALDAALPLPERYEVPAETVARSRAQAARRSGDRRRHDGRARARRLRPHAARCRPSTGWTGLRIGPGLRPRAVDALLTGLHQRGETHFELLRAFAPDGGARRRARARRDRGIPHPRVRRCDGRDLKKTRARFPGPENGITDPAPRYGKLDPVQPQAERRGEEDAPSARG